MKCLPNIKMNRGQSSVVLPKLMTRVDIGCMRNGIFDPWVNEIEFVPSWFPEFNRYPLDGIIGDQMALITKKLLNTTRKPKALGTRKTPSRVVVRAPLSVKRWKRILNAPNRKVIS